MRIIKLTGRECSILHAIGFTESMLGAEIQHFTLWRQMWPKS